MITHKRKLTTYGKKDTVKQVRPPGCAVSKGGHLTEGLEGGLVERTFRLKLNIDLSCTVKIEKHPILCISIIH